MTLSGCVCARERKHCDFFVYHFDFVGHSLWLVPKSIDFCINKWCYFIAHVNFESAHFFAGFFFLFFYWLQICIGVQCQNKSQITEIRIPQGEMVLNTANEDILWICIRSPFEKCTLFIALRTQTVCCMCLGYIFCFIHIYSLFRPKLK